MPHFHLVSFRRSDTGAPQVASGHPFEVAVEVEDWFDEGGPCAVKLSVEPPSVTLSTRTHHLTVPATGVGEARFSLSVEGAAGTQALITARLTSGRRRTLALMIRGGDA